MDEVEREDLGHLAAEVTQECFEIHRVEHAQHGPVDLVHSGEVLVGGRDDRAVGILQPVEPGFQPLHRDAAQIDDVAAHGPFIRGHEGAHDVLVIQDDIGMVDDPRAQIILDHFGIAHGLPLSFFRRLAGSGRICARAARKIRGCCSGVPLAGGLQRIFCPVFAQSFRNASSPLSVSGWLAIALMTAGGAVATSAPILAASAMWFTVRIEAARICVSKP